MPFSCQLVTVVKVIRRAIRSAICEPNSRRTGNGPLREKTERRINKSWSPLPPRNPAFTVVRLTS